MYNKSNEAQAGGITTWLHVGQRNNAAVFKANFTSEPSDAIPDVSSYFLFICFYISVWGFYSKAHKNVRCCSVTKSISHLHFSVPSTVALSLILAASTTSVEQLEHQGALLHGNHQSALKVCSTCVWHVSDGVNKCLCVWAWIILGLAVPYERTAEQPLWSRDAKWNEWPVTRL